MGKKVQFNFGIAQTPPSLGHLINMKIKPLRESNNTKPLNVQGPHTSPSPLCHFAQSKYVYRLVIFSFYYRVCVPILESLDPGGVELT